MSDFFYYIVAIDGPSGVGKGTLAQFLTCKTHFHLLDSGAIYRALAFGAMKSELALDDVPGLVKLAKELPITFVATRILYDGVDVTSKVRTEEIAGIASTIAVIPEVRAALVTRQQDFAQEPGLIADGRDMGTVIFPNANLKVYLTASAKVRAKRRVEQLKSQGISASIVQVILDIEARDDRDLNRKTAPLKPAEDAIIIDTSDLSIEAVCQKVVSLLLDRGIIK